MNETLGMNLENYFTLLENKIKIFNNPLGIYKNNIRYPIIKVNECFYKFNYKGEVFKKLINLSEELNVYDNLISVCNYNEDIEFSVDYIQNKLISTKPFMPITSVELTIKLLDLYQFQLSDKKDIILNDRITNVNPPLLNIDLNYEYLEDICSIYTDSSKDIRYIIDLFLHTFSNILKIFEENNAFLYGYDFSTYISKFFVLGTPEELRYNEAIDTLTSNHLDTIHEKKENNYE